MSTQPEAPEATVRTRQRRAPYPHNAIIHLTGKQPRRKSERTMKRFELYRPGMTIKAFLDGGGMRQDLFYDVWAKLIEIQPPAEPTVDKVA